MTQPGQQPATRPLVFISYSHKDEAWKDELLPHLRALELDDQLEVWHDSRIDVGGRWRDEIVQALNRSSVAVCLVSKHFLASKFIVREEIRHFLEQARGWGLPILPLLLNYCPWRSIRWLRDLQILPGGDETIEKHYADSFDEIFAKLADRVSVIVNEPAFAPPPPRDEVIPTIAERAGLLDQNIEVRGHGNEIIQIVGSSNTIVFRERPGADDATLRADEPEWPALAPELVDIERLPVTGAELFGRQAELTLLDEAWAEGKTNVVSLIAWGGVGKSTLVNKWLEGLEADNWRGAARVYGWSFYSQGTGERASSADEFIAEALAFFGDSDPKQGSPWSRGERLAKLLRQEKTLLVLDGLEPLQSGHEFEKGRIKDPGLARLIEELARDHQGLCVITTRERVAELDEEDWRACVRQEDLEQLSPEAGRALLRVKGVRGSDAELEQASRNFGKHALAISLLANFLRAIPGRPVAAAREIPDLDIPVEKGRHPRRVMAAFAARFGDGPEVELLRVLGLFDRPAGAGPIAALREPPPIPGLTDHIATLDEADWLRLLARLRDMGLIAPDSDHAPDEVDAHPLVREHFGEELREKNLDAWRAGHARLHEHLKATPDKERPLLEDLAPLFQAVFHGCQAGRHQEALDEVYWARIHRHEEYYATRKLGAFGADLAALAGFFEEPWQKPVASITEADQSWVLAEAGYRLRALGRLREALAPMLAALEAMAKREEWEKAAIVAGNLGELHLALGEIVQAVARGRGGRAPRRPNRGRFPASEQAGASGRCAASGRRA